MGGKRLKIMKGRCINPKCNKTVLTVDFFCPNCLVNLSIFTRLGLYCIYLEKGEDEENGKH